MKRIALLFCLMLLLGGSGPFVNIATRGRWHCVNDGGYWVHTDNGRACIKPFIQGSDSLGEVDAEPPVYRFNHSVYEIY